MPSLMVSAAWARSETPRAPTARPIALSVWVNERRVCDMERRSFGVDDPCRVRSPFAAANTPCGVEVAQTIVQKGVLMANPRTVAMLVGSLRKESFTRKMANALIALAAP